MDLLNRAGVPASIFTTSVAEDRLLASVIVRATYRIDGHTLVPDTAAPWPVDGQPIKTEFGDFDGDSPFRRKGTDLFVLGRAYPDAALGAGRGRVEIQVGTEHSHHIDVFGRRTWQARGQSLVPSAAAAFDAVALTWANAYGGQCAVDAGAMGYPPNPKGKGYYLTREQAEGGELPQLEDPDHPIVRWEDQPAPVCTAPLGLDSSMRGLRSADFDTSLPNPKVLRVRQEFHNNAAPAMLMPRPMDPDAIVRIRGVRPQGRELRLRLPGHQFHVHVQLANRAYVFPSQIDSFVVLAEEERVVVGHRCTFRYRFVPLERRAAVLYEGPCPAVPAPDRLLDWDRLDQAPQSPEVGHG